MSFLCDNYLALSDVNSVGSNSCHVNAFIDKSEASIPGQR